MSPDRHTSAPAASHGGLGSLQGRLLWSTVLVLLLALGGLGLRTVLDASERLEQEETARARALARSVALTIENPLLTQQFDQVEEALLRLALMPGLRELLVTDANGQVLSHVAAEPGADPVVRIGSAARRVPTQRQALIERPVSDDTEPRLAAWHPVGQGRPVGWVLAVHALDDLVALRQQVVQRTVVTAVAAAALGGLLLLGLLRGPLASLRDAGRFALQLRAVDGRQMAMPVGAPRETRELVGSLNQASSTLATQARAIEQALAEVRRHGDELDQRNHELDAILAINPNGLLALDAQDRVRFASAAFGRFTGLEPAALIGLSIDELEQQLRERSGVAADWPGFGVAFAVHAAAQGAAGAPLLTLTRPQPRELRLEQGRVDTAGLARLIAVQDVTHEREVDRLKSEFLTTAAHELRTPMVSIHGFTELMLRRQLPPERQRTMLEAVHRNSALMNHIVNELLDLARIEARRGADFDRQPQDLGTLLREAVAGFQPPPSRSAPRVLGAADALAVMGDADKLRQVLFNLLSNAYKYSPAGGPVTVQLLEAGGDAGQAGFSVTDAGIGMTPEQQSRVFERFYRADPSGNQLGTGLGMSIVREIVQLHGGQVQLASEPGMGTTVTVWLPRREAAQAPQAAGAETAAA